MRLSITFWGCLHLTTIETEHSGIQVCVVLLIDLLLADARTLTRTLAVAVASSAVASSLRSAASRGVVGHIKLREQVQITPLGKFPTFNYL